MQICNWETHLYPHFRLTAWEAIGMITVGCSRKNLDDLAIVGDKREANFLLHSLSEDALPSARNLVRSDPGLLLITEGTLLLARVQIQTPSAGE